VKKEVFFLQTLKSLWKNLGIMDVVSIVESGLLARP
jgi:hypothetical protein